MYLTASRPDIMFAVCTCARFQVTPKTSHLHAVKRIFRYLKGQPKLGLWYPRDSPFDLEAFFDSDYAGASLDKKSTTGAPEGEGSAVHPEPYPTPSTSQPTISEPQITSLHIETSPTTAPQTEARQTAVSQIVFHKAHIEQILPSPTTYQRKRKTQKCRKTKKDTELPQTSVPLGHRADDVVHKEGVIVWKVLSLLWQSQTPRHHGGIPAQTRMEHTFELTDNVPSTPHDSPLTGGYTPGIDEGRMKLDELITLYTKLLKQVLDLEKEKDAQAVEILTLKKRVKKLERKRKSFDDEDVTMAMAQTLIKMKEQKAKEKGVAITDVEDSSRTVRSITTLQPLPTIDPKDKGKGVLVEEEPVKIKKKDQGDLQIQADAELAQRLHEEELAELERRQKERVAQEEASMAALYEEYDTI
ncbi:hypothetical protein Tco_0065754 [Tanacetum coccineum]